MKIFTEIYARNHFYRMSGKLESISGSGSSLEQTKVLRPALKRIIRDYKIKSLLDIPCGDWNWMKEVDLTGVDYLGGDIVRDLISRNALMYAQSFRVLDLTKDDLPRSDLVMVRDCMVHFSNADIFQALKNIRLSGSKYLFATSFLTRSVNTDIKTGNWRALNLMEEPFNLPEPLEVINEGCTEEENQYNDKSMILWKMR